MYGKAAIVFRAYARSAGSAELMDERNKEPLEFRLIERTICFSNPSKIHDRQIRAALQSLPELR